MKKILILVDMQNGFTRYPQTKDLAERIKGLLEKKLFDVVIATQFINEKNSIYEKIFNWHRLENEEERSLFPTLVPYLDEVVTKYVYTCISPNFLQRLCQLNDGKYPEQIFVAGADTDCCVLKIATDLFEHNIRPVVLTRYCDSNGGEAFHQAGILCMKRLIGEHQLRDNEILSVQDLESL